MYTVDNVALPGEQGGRGAAAGIPGYSAPDPEKRCMTCKYFSTNACYQGGHCMKFIFPDSLKIDWHFTQRAFVSAHGLCPSWESADTNQTGEKQ